jgi:hypothetical protein
LNARKRLITLSNPSSSPFDVAAACQFFEAQPQVANHIAALQSLAEIEGGAIETVSQAAKDAPELPSFLSNERFSLDTVLSSQASAVNIEQAKQCVPDHFLAALVAPALSQKNIEATMKIVNALDSTAIWPASIPSTSHLSSTEALLGLAPFSRHFLEAQGAQSSRSLSSQPSSRTRPLFLEPKLTSKFTFCPPAQIPSSASRPKSSRRAAFTRGMVLATMNTRGVLMA